MAKNCQSITMSIDKYHKQGNAYLKGVNELLYNSYLDNAFWVSKQNNVTTDNEGMMW